MGLREFMNSGTGKVAVGAVAAVLLIAAVAYTVTKTGKGVSKTGGKGGGGVTEIAYVCSSCGNEWKDEASAAPKCPKCGAPAATATWYRCPRCKNEFAGLYTKKIGPGKYEFRGGSDSAWSAGVPVIACPKCKLVIADTKAAAIPAPGTEAVAGGARRGGD